MNRFRTTTMQRPVPRLPAVGTLLLLAGCGDRGVGEAALERALERSRAVVAAEWSYDQDTLPPAQGEREPRIVDRCRIRLPPAAGAESATGGAARGSRGAEPGSLPGSATEGRMLDVECGRIFVALDAAADSAWIERLVEALDVEVEDRGRIPSWATALDEPVLYLLVRVEQGRESRTLERALASEGVRFVDVRQVARRRP